MHGSVRLVAVVLGLVLLLGPGIPREARGQQRLIVGYSTSHDSTDMWLARWEEVLAKQSGIRVENRIFDATDTAFRALYAGATHVSVGGISFALRLNDVSITDKLVVIGLPLPGNDYILVTRPEIGSLRDMVGKRMGVASPGSLSDTLPRLMFRRSGIPVDSVRWIRIGGTRARIAALLAGQIDGGIAHAAEALEAERRGLKLLLNIGKIVDDYVILGMVARKSWLRLNEDLARQMVHTQISMARWAATNQEEYVALGGRILVGADPEILKKAYPLLWEARIWGVNGIEPQKLTNTMQIDVELGDIRQAVPLQEWVDARFSNEFIARNGRFDWDKQKRP